MKSFVLRFIVFSSILQQNNHFWRIVLSPVSANPSNQEQISESELGYAGFYPFVAQLPLHTFDVEENYISVNDSNCFHNYDCPVLTAKRLHELSLDSTNPIFRVSLNEYLLIQIPKVSCSFNSRVFPIEKTTPRSKEFIVNEAFEQCDSSADCRFFIASNTSITLCSDTFKPTESNEWTTKTFLLGLKKNNLFDSEFLQYDIKCNAQAICPAASLITHKKVILHQENSNQYSWAVPSEFISDCDVSPECNSISASLEFLNDRFVWILDYCSAVLKDYTAREGWFYMIKKGTP